MQILSLKIDDHRCLVDFNINFRINEDGGSSTILIGENGTGKSTMIQAILEIMLSFDSDTVAKNIFYQYELEYFYKGSIIKIQQSERHYVISIDGELFSSGALDTVKKHLKKAQKSIFPERVSYFYSGQNNSALDSIMLIEKSYTKECKKLLSRYWNALYLQNHVYEGVFPKEKYNYCTEKLVPVYLISILCGQNSYAKTLLIEQCKFSSVEHVQISLKINNLNHRLRESIDEVGNEGICDLIDFIDNRFTELFLDGFIYYNHHTFYYSLKNLSKTDTDSISLFNFFEKLQNLFDANISVELKVGESYVSCKHLSEGQRQLIKVLGMLSVCKSEDSLVLMDEPDAHMNPKWKYELKEVIDKCLSEGELTNTQAIIATHDPLVINGVPKEYIRIFTYKNAYIAHNNFYFTKVIEPTEDTEGLGIDGLLQSEYYGLYTTLDTKTQEKLEEKRNLMVKRKEGTITEDEMLQLLRLTDELEQMDFSRNIPTDNYFDDFVVAMHEAYQGRPRAALTQEEIAERNQRAREIAERLIDQ